MEEFSSINGDVANQVMRLGILKEFLVKYDVMENRSSRKQDSLLKYVV